MKRNTLTLFILIIQIAAFGQEIVKEDDYFKSKQGIYEPQSLHPKWTARQVSIIESQTRVYTEGKTALLHPKNETIALFDRINDKGIAQPVGVLSTVSFIQVDTIFYREIFKRPTKEWSLTFNVWYAITLNGQQYYTDYKIHDRLSFKKELDEHQQTFLLISQSTGYDEYYDIGYPNYFFVIVLNENDEMVYKSEILDFDYGKWRAFGH